jgi:hypothetical protein
MGLFDKVKGQAEKAMAQAQDLKGKVGDKVDEVQMKRKADDLLDDLGRLLYAERIGRAMAGAEAEITRIVDELKGLEGQGVTILPAEAAASAPPAPEAAAAEPAAPEAAVPEAAVPEAAE